MINHMDIDMIKEEKAMLPGGDLRIKGNAWLRTAWAEAKISRVPREAEFKKIVSNLASHYKLCSPADVYLFRSTPMPKYDVMSSLETITYKAPPSPTKVLGWKLLSVKNG